MHRVDLHGRRCRLFTSDSRIPKLDVAGSIPVSRSMFSTTYKESALRAKPLNAVIQAGRRCKSLCNRWFGQMNASARTSGIGDVYRDCQRFARRWATR